MRDIYLRQIYKPIDIILIMALMMYGVDHEYLKVVSTIAVIILTMAEPLIAFTSLFVMLFFDQNIVVPFIDKSPSVIMFPLAVSSLFAKKVISKRRQSICRHNYIGKYSMISLMFFIAVVIYSTIIALSDTNHVGDIMAEYSFSDPMRGVAMIVLLCLMMIIVKMSTARNVFEYICSKLWIVPVSGFLSILYAASELYTGGRFAATVGDPNYAARALLVAICVSMLIYKKTSTRIILCATFTVMVVMTGSRAGIIANIVLYLFYITCVMKQAQALKSKSLNLYIACLSLSTVVSILFAEYLVNATSVGARFVSPESIKIGQHALEGYIDRVTSGRSLLWYISFQEWISQGYLAITFGVGIGKSGYLVMPFLGRFIVVHNTFLDLLYETGIVGFISISCFMRGIYQATRCNYLQVRLSSCILIVFIVMAFTLSGAWTKQTLILLSLVCIARYYESTCCQQVGVHT